MAPFLTALGFDPITAIAVALLGDCTCTSWGGAGLTTISGGAALVTEGISTTALNSAMGGRINSLGLLIVPVMAVIIAFGPKALKGVRADAHLTLAAKRTVLARTEGEV